MAVILVTSRSFGDGDLDGHARAAEAGHTIVRGPAHHPLDDLAEVLPTVDAWIAGTGPVTTEHLDLAPRLVVIARYGVGVEAVDVAAATGRGIVVSNTPGANAEAVAVLPWNRWKLERCWRRISPRCRIPSIQWTSTAMVWWLPSTL